MLRLGSALLLFASIVLADVSNCACDPAKPETMKARECSLCAEAEKQPTDAEFFVLKDINPRKPNRWLVLPRSHSDGAHHMHHMSRAERTRFWKFAIEEARKRFGDGWGAAYNGWRVRTQCHAHIHIGRIIEAAKIEKFKFVRRVEDIPAPEDSGIWVYAVPGGYRIHTGEQICETALVR